MRAEPAMALFRALPRRAAKVPQVICQMGWEDKLTFINHPGVMAVCKLLDLRYITRPRANFTPETVERIAEFDTELARKAQIALDNGLAINFIDLETIEEDLPRLVEEKKQLVAARKAVLEAPAGKYDMPKLDLSSVRPQPRALSAMR